ADVVADHPVDDEISEHAHAQEPLRVGYEIEPRSPALMRGDVARQRGAEGERREGEDQHAVERCGDAFDEARARLANPDQIEPGKAQAGYGEQIQSAIPAVERGEALADRGNELQRAAEGDDAGAERMREIGDVAACITRYVWRAAERFEPVPDLEVPGERRR